MWVRLVWWGFRALKTPERAYLLPTLCVGSLTCAWVITRKQITGQRLDIRPACSGDAPMLNGPEPEVLTFNALLTILGRRSRQSIYDLMRRDPTFPRPRQIGSEFSVGWLCGEVMEWLNARPRVQFNGLDAVERRRRSSAGKRGAEVT